MKKPMIQSTMVLNLRIKIFILFQKKVIFSEVLRQIKEIVKINPHASPYEAKDEFPDEEVLLPILKNRLEASFAEIEEKSDSIQKPINSAVKKICA